MNGPKPTKADLRRFDQLQIIGCICCRHEGRNGVPSDIHHIKQGQHQMTLPLCEYHHRGYIPEWAKNRRTAEEILGPSLALSKKRFVAKYGSEIELLQEVNDLL